MANPILLDLFCCAGGAAMGYHRAGFEVVGVDMELQPNYPFPYCKMDAMLAMNFLLGKQRIWDIYDNYWTIDMFSAIHASPPCQAYSKSISPLVGHRKEHPDLIKETRENLLDIGKPFVLENVPGSPMTNYISLDGTMFGLKTKKKRQFELYGFDITLLPGKLLNTRGMVKNGQLVGIVGHSKYPNEIVANKENLADAYGIDWVMNRHELRQAIPPDYTEYIGKYLMQEVLRRKNENRSI